MSTMEWQIRALTAIENNIPIHEVERLELIDDGFITCAHPNAKCIITLRGKEILARGKSADFASKRY